MHWDQPLLLLLLAVVPLLLIVRRRPAARPAAVLWVRSGRWGGRAGALLMRAGEALP